MKRVLNISHFSVIDFSNFFLFFFRSETANPLANGSILFQLIIENRPLWLELLYANFEFWLHVHNVLADVNVTANLSHLSTINDLAHQRHQNLVHWDGNIKTLSTGLPAPSPLPHFSLPHFVSDHSFHSIPNQDAL